MKSILSILFSIVILGASLQNGLLMFDYKINQNFYEIHCINKAKPEMDCHGKCQAKEESEKSTNPFNLVKYSFEFNILPAKTAEFFIMKESCVLATIPQFAYQDQFVPEIILGIVPQPPQV